MTTGTFAQQQVVKFKPTYSKDIQHSEILSIYQDHQGLIWLGSFNGLFRYDPYKTKNYFPSPTDSTGIHNNTVNDIIGDHQGNLWLATNTGLEKFDRTTETFTQFGVDSTKPDQLLPHPQVRSLVMQDDGTIWAATARGLARFHPPTGQMSLIRDLSGKGGQVLNDVYIDSNNELWIGSEDSAVSVLNLTTLNYRHYQVTCNPRPGTTHQTVNCFYQDTDGVMWMGSWNHGIRYFNKDSARFVKPALDSTANRLLEYATVRTISQKDSAHLWLGTFYSGLYLYNKLNGNVTQYLPSKYHAENHLTSAMIWQLHTDKDGNLWVGTFGGGLHMHDFRQHTFPHYKARLDSDSSLISNEIISTLEDHQGNIWFGTGGHGLSKWNPTTGLVQNYLTRGEREGHIRILFEDKIGRIWAGTENGAYYYHQRSDEFRHIGTVANPADGDAKWPCYAITQDQEGHMWFGFYATGTYKMLAHQMRGRRPETVPISKIYGPKPGNNFPGVSCYQLLLDQQNRLWMQRDDNLVKFDLNKNQFEVYSNFYASTLHQDKAGNIWAGLYDSDLYHYNEATKQFERHPVSDHSITSITNILRDSSDQLWVFNFNGAYRYNPTDSTTVHFSTLEGLQNNFIHYYTSQILSNGQILIAGKNGYNIFNPYTVEQQVLSPPVYISDFKLFNESVTPDWASGNEIQFQQTIGNTETIILKHHQNMMTFDFCASDYSSPELVRYRYKMEGFDQDFLIAPVGTRSATYTNMDPGQYRLVYQATNSVGQWMEPGQSINIKVIPPYWQAWWFKTLVGLIAALIAFLMVRSRILRVRRKYRLQQAEQERAIVKLRNDKLRQDLEHRNNELRSATMNLIRRNNSIQQIQSRLEELTAKLPDSHKGRFKLFLKQLNREKKDEMTWDEFVRNFDTTHNDFISRFRETYPQLTQKDLKMCAYLRMNLSNHEIASVLNVSLRSVETTRYRIRLKIDLKTKDTLSEYIFKF